MESVSSSTSRTPTHAKNEVGPIERTTTQVRQLEQQLADLRESTRLALLSSWKETENVRVDLEKSQAELAEHKMKSADLELQLHHARVELKRETKERQEMEQKYQEAVRGDRDSDKDSSSCVSETLTGSLLVNFGGNISGPNSFSSETSSKSQLSLPQKSSDESCPNPGYPFLKRSTSYQMENRCQGKITASTGKNNNQFTPFGSLGSLSALVRSRPSDFEEDLMGQLTTINQVKKQEDMEFELKLQQREAAIKTLECTTKLQSNTILQLRNELDCLRDQVRSCENADVALLQGLKVPVSNNDRPQSVGNTPLQLPRLNFGRSGFYNSKNAAAVTESLAHELSRVQLELQNKSNQWYNE